jgi:hypothetical protein
MRMTTRELEEELRALYGAVDAPPAPPSWAAQVWPPATLARAPRRGRSRMLVRTPVALAVAAAVVLTVMVSRRGGPAPTPPSTQPATLMVAVLPAGAALTCRLPISALSNDHTTGFITMSAGQGSFQPAQVSADAMTYLPALQRWVDVLPQFVSPDGTAYVTVGGGASDAIHIVDAHGDRAVPTHAPAGVFAWTRRGLLLLAPSDRPDPLHGETLDLDLVDPTTGALTPLAPIQLPGISGAGGGSETGYVRAGDSVWTTAYDPGADATTVTRHDLATGQDTVWFDGRSDGHGHAQVVGADASGAPLVQLSDQDLFHSDPAHRAGISERILLLGGPHQATVLNEGTVGAPGVADDLSPESVTDGGQVWLAGDDGGIWVYTSGAGLREVAKVTTSTQGSPGVVISGPCR